MIAVAVIAAVIAIFVVAGGRGGKGGGKQPPAATSGDDPWAEPTGGPASEAAKLFQRKGPAPAWLRARPAGPPVTVTGTVRMAPGGAPVAGAEVAFLNDSGENTATSDGVGRYQITVASGIAWRVHARTEAAVGYPESFIPTGDAPVRDLEVHATATVRGRVIDMRGAPVAGAELSLHVDAAARPLLESSLPMSATADGAGRFELQALPGAVLIKGQHGKRQGVGVLSTLAPGETAEVEIKLLDAITVTGRVVDGAGKEVGDAKVLAAVTIHPGGPTEKLQLDTRPDGGFEFTMPAGWLRLEARRHGELSPASAQWVGSGERLDNVELKIARPTGMRGKVITSAGTPVSGARVRLVAHAVYDAVTGNDGTFAVEAIAGQPYLVKVRHTDGMLDRQVAAWNGEEVFVMKPFGGIRVLAPGTTGELTVTVDSFLPAGEDAPRAPAEARFRGAGGSVVLANLEPGVYDLTVSAGTAGSVRVPRIGVAEGAMREVKVALAAPVTVRGIVKSGGQPIGGARVAIGGKAGFSDSKGRWSIADVPAGPVAVVVTKANFGTAWASGVAAEDGEPISVEMRPASDAAGLVEGIGVVLAPASQGAVVVSVLPGAPAEGKLAAGDVIAEVGGTDVSAAPMEEIVARLRGTAGSSVSIERRRGDESATVDVVRKRLVVPQGTPSQGLALRARARIPSQGLALRTGARTHASRPV